MEDGVCPENDLQASPAKGFAVSQAILQPVHGI
jgi:hypothetical protein